MTPPEIAANVLLGLTTAGYYLRQKRLEALEQAFLKEGGLWERMTMARLETRKQNERDKKDGKDPIN